MGRAVFLGNCLIDWKSHRCKRIMTSTHHSEFYASNEASKDAVFYHSLGLEIDMPMLAEKVEIFGDNEKALELAEGRVSATKSRHYDLLLFYQREQFELGRVGFTFIRSSENLSDIFTKGRFSKEHFKELRCKLMGTEQIPWGFYTKL